MVENQAKKIIEVGEEDKVVNFLGTGNTVMIRKINKVALPQMVVVGVVKIAVKVEAFWDPVLVILLRSKQRFGFCMYAHIFIVICYSY